MNNNIFIYSKGEKKTNLVITFKKFQMHVRFSGSVCRKPPLSVLK